MVSCLMVNIAWSLLPSDLNPCINSASVARSSSQKDAGGCFQESRNG